MNDLTVTVVTEIISQFFLLVTMSCTAYYLWCLLNHFQPMRPSGTLTQQLGSKQMLRILIFQLSDWFPKPIIWAIIIKFDQIRKNWWRISCAEILKVGKNCFAASSVKKMSRFEEVSPKEIKRIAWKFSKTVIPLELAGYELIITNVEELNYFVIFKFSTETNERWKI